MVSLVKTRERSRVGRVVGRCLLVATRRARWAVDCLRRGALLATSGLQGIRIVSARLGWQWGPNRDCQAEIAELRPEVRYWRLLERDGIARLERVFQFPSFADALAFTNRVGTL